MIERDKASRPAPKPRNTEPLRWNVRRVRRAILRGLTAIFLLVAIAFALDYGVLRYRVAFQKSPYDQVWVRVYYAVGQKSGKVELDFHAPQQVTCVKSLFPHFGMSACWWLRSHPEQRQDFFQQ